MSIFFSRACIEREITEREVAFKFARERPFCVVGLDAVRFSGERRSCRKMLAVSRFKRKKKVDLGKVRTGEGALVHNLFNARAGGGNLSA